MFSLIISLVCLVVGYITYGKFVEKMFIADPSRPTPVISHADGVDYVKLQPWKVFLIQFLNIAGTGPIFGAIMGAMFGPACFIWIVLGSIFAGGVHDYLSGMLSIRHDGQSIPNIVGDVFGKKARTAMLIFTLILLMFVGSVFVFSPSLILGKLSQPLLPNANTTTIWMILIFAYFIAGTLFPIDKVVGKIYPLFGFLMLFMAAALLFHMLRTWPSIPEFWDGLQNRRASTGAGHQPLFPCLFVTVACGAVSGFHSTQSPIMSRCLENEKYGRPIFYGAMIAEGAVALIWAAVSSWFFFDGGMEEIGLATTNASEIVPLVSYHWLGIIGGILAIVGVVVAPITSGDTAFRSARLIIAESLNLEQRKIRHRLEIAVPIFIVAFGMVWFNIADADGFNVLWRHFGLSNQFLACVVLWCSSIYFSKTFKDMRYLITFIPACFLSAVCASFVCVDKTCLGLPETIIPWICIAIVSLCLIAFRAIQRKYIRNK
ncbi:MAG: carbon starvation protein A [Bacteroidales bacterium]|nr:carbon starvation protein A [Bacteroidales bacterium]